jgi:tetratricopeptide (TPR) repeat protein
MPTAPPPARAGLLAELRRRGVTQALVGYAVAAFAVLQVAEPILHALKLPDSWLTGVVVLLALGFPLVAALSWAYDLTRHGLVRAPAQAVGEGGASGGPAAGSARASRVALPAALLVSALLGAGLAWLALRPPAPVADADGRVSVAVADFANQTGEPALDALSGLLITSLEQSKKLKVLTRGRMFDLLRQAGREQVNRIDESAAREVGLKARVRALLLASVVKLGGAYVVELRALDPVKDHYLFTLREQAADQAALLPLVDRLSERVRGALQEQAAEVKGADVQVAAAVTPSLEAYRHYFKGKELRARLQDKAAKVEFEKALGLEPRFALAQLELGLIGMFWAEPEVEQLIRAAATNAARLPEKERELILAYVDGFDGRAVEAERRAFRLVERYSEDGELVHLAAQMAQDPAVEFQLRRRLVALAPDNEQAWAYLAAISVPLGRAGEVLAAAVPAERARPTAGMAVAVGLARLGTGRAAEAIEDFRRALQRGAEEGIVGAGLAISLLAVGDRVAFLAGLEGEKGLGKELGLSGLEIKEGKLKAASARLGRLGEPKGPAGSPWRQERACLHAAAGDLATARRVASEQAEVPVLDDFWYLAAPEAVMRAAQAQHGADSRTGRWLRAISRREQGDLAGAVAALGPLDPLECGRRTWLLGTLEAARGRHAEAEALLGRLEPCVSAGGAGVIDFLLHADGRIRRAGSLAALGRTAEARPLVERQLREWKDADADLPLLAEARAVCKQVGCQAP